MQFHHQGYVSGNPRVHPVAGTGIDRPAEIPHEVDVLIVGSGPAGMLLAAQLAQFPDITTRIVERRAGRLKIGQADGIQARSVETFQAFGFAGRITAEAFNLVAMNFWNPDPANPDNIIRTSREPDATGQFSEFPHLIVNQARVLDYFAEAAANAPTRTTPDYGLEFTGLEVNEGNYPVRVSLRHTDSHESAPGFEVGAKYVVGCDGARSNVRAAIGRTMTGEQAMHAWAVMDVLAVTDFPDIRTKCAIQSHHGSILHIPREGGYLFRMYVDLGELTHETEGVVRDTTFEQALAKANEIIHPYTLDVRKVAWYTVYEVGHRLTDKFDDVPEAREGQRTPRVFIAGDACHTHSAKAGQGMNVSMQDGFNLGWKLGAVLEGRSPESLLATYSAERQTVAQDLIDFDKEWSAMMAKQPEEFERPEELGEFYQRTFEFPTGFMTQYAPSIITGEMSHQGLAEGFPIGKRFKSEMVDRVADAVPIHIGHHARADGRWRLYAFADEDHSALDSWARWLAESDNSPMVRYTPSGKELDAVFDAKVIYQQGLEAIDIDRVPGVFFPRNGPYQLIDYEKVYATNPEQDIFESRGINRGGCVVIVRPDQYVAHVLPLSATEELATFFAQNMREPAAAGSAS
jgi:phenol 2-monooxygenase